MIEGIQLSVAGELVSGLVSNVFMVIGGGLRTPRLESGCLPGVTRAVVLSLARRLGMPVVEEYLTPADLEHAEEVFFTNTLMECLPVSTVNGRRVAQVPGVVTRALSAALTRYIAESNEEVLDEHRLPRTMA
jgi:branched-chain amino acid aminotransferase